MIDGPADFKRRADTPSGPVAFLGCNSRIFASIVFVLIFNSVRAWTSRFISVVGAAGAGVAGPNNNTRL